MLKRISVVCIVAVLIVSMTGALAAGTAHAGISFRVYGALSMLNPNDYNNYLETYLVEDYGGEIITLDKLSSAIPYGVDVRFGGNPGLSLSLGFTRFGGKAGFSWEDVFWGESLERKDTISVTGGLVSVVYALESRSPSLYFLLGAGYYMVTLKKTVPAENLLFRDESEYTAKKNQLGFHAGVGVQIPVFENIVGVVEFGYRLLTISEMTFTEHDDPDWVDGTWEHKLNLGGINILVGVNIVII